MLFINSIMMSSLHHEIHSINWLFLKYNFIRVCYNLFITVLRLKKTRFKLLKTWEDTDFFWRRNDCFLWYFNNCYALSLKNSQLNIDYLIITTKKCTWFKMFDSFLSDSTSDTTWHSICLAVYRWKLVHRWICVRLLG